MQNEKANEEQKNFKKRTIKLQDTFADIDKFGTIDIKRVFYNIKNSRHIYLSIFDVL